MNKRGFTLTELLISISIIAILVTIAVAAYSSVNKQSRDAKRKGDLEQIRSALEMYRTDNGSYPAVNTTNFDVASNLSAALVPTYIPVIPSDPKSPSQTYYLETTNAVGGNYYGYCVCALLEISTSASTTCSVTLPANCNYGLKNP